MRKTIDFLKAHPLITGIIGVTIGVAATKVFTMDTIGKIAFLRIVLTMAMSMFVYLISREKSFENCHTTTGYVVKWGILTVIPELLLLLGFVFLYIKRRKRYSCRVAVESFAYGHCNCFRWPV